MIKIKKPNISLKKALPKWSSKNIKNGSYSLGAAAMAVAIAVVCNLVAGKIPAQYRSADLTTSKLYTIGEQTEEIVAALDEDVTIYLIAESGDEDETIQRMLERYEGLSSHIKVETKDPVLHPNFVSNYTEDSLADNSLIVESEKRSKVIPYSDMYESSFSYSTYSYSTTGFDGEGQVTSAIAYVMSDDLPVIYNLTGHGEESMTDEMTTAIAKENIDMQELNLLTEEAVPEDADSVVIFSPTQDISEEEADKLITYLEGGGCAYIVTTYTGTEMPNLQKVLNNYGIGTKEGVVVEGDGNYYVSGNPLYLVPNIGSADALGDLSSSNSFVLMPIAQAVDKLEDKRDTVTIESLLTTSDSAYVKTDVNNTLEKESGDETGAFDLGVAVTETVTGGETKLLYFTSVNLFSQQINAMVSGSNLKLLSSGLSWMCDQEQTVSIASKSTTVSYLTVTSASGRMWGVVTIGIIPVFCLLLGGSIWFRRRKR
jgi:ABC-2 type transport system permease protein